MRSEIETSLVGEMRPIETAVKLKVVCVWSDNEAMHNCDSSCEYVCGINYFQVRSKILFLLMTDFSHRSLSRALAAGQQQQIVMKLHSVLSNMRSYFAL